MMLELFGDNTELYVLLRMTSVVRIFYYMEVAIYENQAKGIIKKYQD